MERCLECSAVVLPVGLLGDLQIPLHGNTLCNTDVSLIDARSVNLQIMCGEIPALEA